MSARKEISLQPSAGDRRLRDEIEADVFEIWVGVSRLMSRLRESGAPYEIGRRPTRRQRTNAPRRPV